MKPEIIKFYADKGLHISKMINRRPPDIGPEHIEAACDLLYTDIQGGAIYKDIAIVPAVFRLAKDINGEAYAQAHKVFRNHEKIIISLKKELVEKQEELRKFKLWVISGVAVSSWGYVIYYYLSGVYKWKL